MKDRAPRGIMMPRRNKLIVKQSKGRNLIATTAARSSASENDETGIISES